MRSSIYTTHVNFFANLRDSAIAIIRFENPLTSVGALPVYAFNIDGKDNGEFANDLSMTYGIEGRPGLHCSPLAHRTLGTFPEGALRLSPGYYTTEDEIDYTIESIRALTSK